MSFPPYSGSGVYANGEILPGLWYQAVVSNNNSALGVKASQLDRKMDFRRDRCGGCRPRTSSVRAVRTATGSGTRSWRRGSDSVRIQPGAELPRQLGQRRGIRRCASRISSICSRPARWPPGSRYRTPTTACSRSTRASSTRDLPAGRVLPALARQLRRRRLLPVGEIKDSGFYVQGLVLPDPAVLELYARRRRSTATARRDSATLGILIGTNWYPFDTRNHRLNVQLIDVNSRP